MIPDTSPDTSTDTCTDACTAASPEAQRFRTLFRRDPSPTELDVFRAAREALVLRLPGRVRRSTARVIARV